MQHGEQWPARPVIGTRESIAQLSAKRADRWLARTHQKGNASLFVRGDHTADAVNALLKKHFGPRPSGPRTLPPDYTCYRPETSLHAWSNRGLYSPFYVTPGS